jgi:hypothetical protein
MTTNDGIQQEYNKYTEFPFLSYNCISYLMQNNEDIWKLLKYNTANALNEPNLTNAQKAALIYKGQEKETDFRVFFDGGQDDSWKIECGILRIYPYDIDPINWKIGNISLCLQVFCHYKVNHLVNYTTRVDTIIQNLIETLNGADIEGIGRLHFNKKAARMSGVRDIGTIPFRGKVLMMGNNALG